MVRLWGIRKEIELCSQFIRDRIFMARIGLELSLFQDVRGKVTTGDHGS
jgi:hypothetical protein